MRVGEAREEEAPSRVPGIGGDPGGLGCGRTPGAWGPGGGPGGARKLRRSWVTYVCSGGQD